MTGLYAPNSNHKFPHNTNVFHFTSYHTALLLSLFIVLTRSTPVTYAVCMLLFWALALLTLFYKDVTKAATVFQMYEVQENIAFLISLPKTNLLQHQSIVNMFVCPSWLTMHEHTFPLSDKCLSMCENFGSEPTNLCMGPHHHPNPIHPLSANSKLLFVITHTEATGDYFWALSPVFPKGRSRVWLTSRRSWTGWLANKTPWFQLTTYHRQQRTKREGNKNSCIVHCIITLEK